MVDNPRLRGFIEFIEGMEFNNDIVSDQNLMNLLKLNDTNLDQTFVNFPPNFVHDPNPNNFASSSSVSPEDDSPENSDFSDVLLKYINQILMEEDLEEKNSLFQESSVLQATEKPFYEILHPPSPESHSPPSPDTQVDNFTGSFSNYSSNNITSVSSNAADLNSVVDHFGQYNLSHIQRFPSDYTFRATSQSSFGSSHSYSPGVEGFVQTPVSNVQIPDLYCENEPIWHFRRGVEEASKFLPSDNSLIVNLEKEGILKHEGRKEARGVAVKEEKKDHREYSQTESKGKKNLKGEYFDIEEGRSYKQSAVSSEETVRSDMFDRVLLCKGHKEQENVNSTLRQSMKTETNKNVQQNGHSKGSNGGKSRGRKQSGKKDVVDLRTLLIHCAQAVASDDRRNADELLKQLRKHSSPFGDGSQRLAHYFANGLEARLAGTGSQIYAALMNKRTPAADILKAYQLYLSSCPFKKMSLFFSNQTIMNMAETASTIHIVDFGILYGFQWPCLIERLSARRGGPPKLRITGIDFPQGGFRPAQRIEETGLRLANYAESFNVPFEYKAIAQKWETVRIEDLKINKDEVLVVNCLYRFNNLLDETVMLDSPRNAVLNLIRKMNPNVFIYGVGNGAFSAPFFVTRFREALFHYSSLYDMLETNIPRENPDRIIIERDFYGREALNVIACEGSERVERPETYKQLQVRIQRAGFRQLPLNKEMMKKVREKVRSGYHKDFVVDEDSQWMLQGWKGRIAFAFSTWVPV